VNPQPVAPNSDAVGRPRAVVADDSAVIRSGVVRILEGAGIAVVGEARTADELLAVVAAESPDLAVVDIRMPPGGNAGLVAALEIRARHADRVRVLVLSQYLEPEYALRLLSAGADGVGYLLKDRLGEASELADAAHRVASGGSAIDPSVVDELVRARRATDQLGRLTPRELETLALVAEGRSNRSIADLLGVSPKTVEGAISVIFSKLGLEEDERDNRRVLAVLTYLDGGAAARTTLGG
jgi:DNA-binding NarL/FixJ family response regulator